IGYVLDSRLNVLRKIMGLPRASDLYECHDIDGDSLLEHLFLDLVNGQLIIFNHRLEYPVKVDYPRDTRNLWFSTGNLPANGPVFQVSSQNTLHVFRYEKNPLALWEAPIYLLLFLMLSGLLALIFHYRERRLRLGFEQRQRMLELELLALRNQVEPHFTFNVMNLISSLIMQGRAEDARAHLQGFSTLLRLAVQRSDQVAVTLEEELEFTREYLELQRSRFAGAFRYLIEKDTDIPSTLRVPRLCIHTFAENSLKHGLSTRPGDGMIRIRLKREAGTVLIVMEDNGPGREATQGNGSTGKGLKIMKEMFGLYRKLTGTMASFEVEDLYAGDGRPSGTRVVVMVDVVMVDG
ncbi:MAG TPA: histidine kinase, partial [Bacteroidales bacterium]|nr:histidine kinase [Bacteroidales bacterium]